MNNVMATPKISVIIPCYNVAPWVERCLESVSNQTLQDIEIICVDDKSTDTTAQILKRIAEKDSRIKLLFLENNSGAGVARNTGLKEAKGEYIGFLDPDDYIDLDFYEKLYITSKAEKTDIVKASLWQTNEDKPSQYLNKLIKQNIAWFYGEYTTAIYKHSFLIQHSISFPTNVITGQDSVFLTNVVIFKPSISIVDNTFYRYYRREGSLDSLVLSHQKAISRLNMLTHKINLIKNANLSAKDFNLFIEAQIFPHIRGLIGREYEIEDDINLFWDFLHNMHKQYTLQKELQNSFGKKILSCLNSSNYIEKCNNYRCCKKKRLYLFCIIPFILLLTCRNITWIKFLEIIPLVKIKTNKSKNKSKFYVFGLIPLFKLKG